MNPIRVNRNAILERIKANRDEHRTIVEEAWKGYLEQIEITSRKQVEDARDGKRYAYAITLVMPQDHTKDYDAVIDMLESSTDDIIEMEPEDFRAYVRDEWNWMGQFLMSNRTYSQTAMTKLGR